MKTIRTLVVLAVLTSTTALHAAPTGTAFTYQGKLNDGGVPANGSYDFDFKLYDGPDNPASQVGSTVTLSNVPVASGLFTVKLDFAGVFDGNARWLEIWVNTNHQTRAQLGLRQELTPAPYAIYSAGASAAGLTGIIPAANLGGTYSGSVIFNNPANSFTGNGTGLTNVNAALLGGLSAAQFWQLGGNGSTTPGVNFLGTTDSMALELKVNNQRGLRIEPAYSAPNLIGGSALNSIDSAGVSAAVIGGGETNRITSGAWWAVIGGGYGNQANGLLATVPGGYFNQASGDFSFAAGQHAQALHHGAFVWADDSTPTPFASTAENQFLVRAGFMGLNRATQITANEYFGVRAPVSGGAYGGMFVETAGMGKPFYGYAQGGLSSVYHYVDGVESNKWKLFTGGADRLTVTSSGQVGIGTTAPTDALLDVEGNVRINDNVLYLRGGTDRNHGLAYSNTVSGIPVNGPFLWGYDGGALGAVTTTAPDVVALKWDYGGNVWVSNNCSVASLTIRGGADLAEPFKISAQSEAVPAGAVVVIDAEHPGQLKMSTRPYDTRVAGVVSGANGIHPGIQMQQEGLLEGGRNVALTGRVYVQADAFNGAIEPGDLLTTSSTPGHAMKVSDPAKAQGAILGKAMTGLRQGKGVVLVLVTLQ